MRERSICQQITNQSVGWAWNVWFPRTNCVCCVCPNFLENTVQGCEHFFSIERTYVPLRQHLGWTNKVLVGHHHHHVHNVNYKSLFSVEPSVSEEILLENNNITVSCKQICPQALHFYQKLQAKRMNFRPTSFQNLYSWLATSWQGGHIGVCWRSLQ